MIVDKCFTHDALNWHGINKIKKREKEVETKEKL